MGDFMNYKKIIVIVLMIFISSTNVYAKNKNIEFNESIFVNYFNNNNYKVDKYNHDYVLSYLKDDKYVDKINSVYTAVKGSFEIDLYVMNTKDDAYSYFKYIYKDNDGMFNEVDFYNFDEKENSNYSYFIGKIDNIRYIYIINIDNYIIKSNAEVNNRKYLDNIYKDLKIFKRNKYLYLLLVFMVLLVIIFATYLIINRKKKIL